MKKFYFIFSFLFLHSLYAVEGGASKTRKIPKNNLEGNSLMLQWRSRKKYQGQRYQGHTELYSQKFSALSYSSRIHVTGNGTNLDDNPNFKKADLVTDMKSTGRHMETLIIYDLKTEILQQEKHSNDMRLNIDKKQSKEKLSETRNDVLKFFPSETNKVDCPLHCVCHYKPPQYKIKCNNKSNLDKIPVGTKPSEIQELQIKSSFLKVIPNNLCKFTNLHQVDLAHNLIHDIKPATFTCLKNLQNLNMTFNNLTILKNGIFDNLKILHTVEFSHNNIGWIEPHVFTISTSIFESSLTSLQFVHLEFNNITKFECWGLLLPKVLLFNMSHNKIDGFTNRIGYSFHILYNTNGTIDVTHNKLKSLQIESLKIYGMSSWTDMINLRSYRFDFNNNPLVCNCYMYILGSMFDSVWGHYIDDPIFHLKCFEPPKLKGLEIRKKKTYDQMVCNLTQSENCPSKCEACIYNPSRNTTTVLCENKNLTSFPKTMPVDKAKYLELKFSNNSITAIPDTKYNNKITLLDVGFNKIIHLKKSVVEELKQRGTHIILQNNKFEYLPKSIQDLTGSNDMKEIDIRYNPLKCDCNMTWMSIWVNENVNKIYNATSLSCLSGIDRLLLSNVKEILFCPDQLTRLLIILCSALGGVVILLIIALILIYKYRWEIKVLMYSHIGWHPFINREEKNLSKVYDAFIAYSHQDVSYVTSELLPYIENRNPPLGACLHHRDFLPGFTIAENITNAIKYSCRTVLVVSQNFIDSQWCLFEFQNAFSTAMQEKQNRIIIILMEDKPLQNVEPQLRAYINTYTYLERSDKLFKEKLLYALPHEPIKLQREKRGLTADISCPYFRIQVSSSNISSPTTDQENNNNNRNSSQAQVPVSETTRQDSTAQSVSSRDWGSDRNLIVSEGESHHHDEDFSRNMYQTSVPASI